MKHCFLLPAVCAAMLAAAGCAESYNEDDHVTIDAGVMESVVIDNQLAGDIRIIQTAQVTTEAGVKGVCVRARLKRAGYAGFMFNSYDKINISYKFTWIDAEGKDVSQGEKYGWNTIQLFPGDEFACTSYAPAKNIPNVKLEIRKGIESAVPSASETAVKPEKTSEKVLRKELPAEIREGKATTTVEIKAKTDEVEKKNKALKEVNEKVRKGSSLKNDCKCGCASGATCYCPEDSPCRKGKTAKPAAK